MKRLLLLLALGTFLLVTVLATADSQIYIKVTTAGYTESHGLKDFLIGLDLQNLENNSLQVLQETL